jgi:hypothetical protein
MQEHRDEHASAPGLDSQIGAQKSEDMDISPEQIASRYLGVIE